MASARCQTTTAPRGQAPITNDKQDPLVCDLESECSTRKSPPAATFVTLRLSVCDPRAATATATDQPYYSSAHIYMSYLPQRTTASVWQKGMSGCTLFECADSIERLSVALEASKSLIHQPAATGEEILSKPIPPRHRGSTPPRRRERTPQ